jgi:hypothetical protein
MTKNIEDLLYRGDSLDKMGEMSGRLREDSRKYKKAAIKINWDAMLAKVSAVFLFTTIPCLLAIGATVFCFDMLYVFCATVVLDFTVFICTRFCAASSSFCLAVTRSGACGLSSCPASPTIALRYASLRLYRLFCNGKLALELHDRCCSIDCQAAA